MNPTLLRAALACAGLTCAAAAVQAAQITIYKQPNFSGDKVTLGDTAADLRSHGINDQASSVVIDSGRWQLCSQPNFAGDCVILEPGRYASLDPKVYHRAESVRRLDKVAAVDDGRITSNDRYGADRRDRPDDGYGRRGEREPAIELYARPDFHGRFMPVDRNTPSLEGTDFDQRASSLVVNEGRWQACSDPGYRGYCRVFEPGRYGDLGRFNNQIGSLRRLG
jgi:hypothetical protein